MTMKDYCQNLLKKLKQNIWYQTVTWPNNVLITCPLQISLAILAFFLFVHHIPLEINHMINWYLFP